MGQSRRLLLMAVNDCFRYLLSSYCHKLYWLYSLYWTSSNQHIWAPSFLVNTGWRRIRRGFIIAEMSKPPWPLVARTHCRIIFAEMLTVLSRRPARYAMTNFRAFHWRCFTESECAHWDRRGQMKLPQYFWFALLTHLQWNHAIWERHFL